MELVKRMLAEMSSETELRINEIKILLFHSQGARRFGSVSSGRLIEPLMKPTLFFTDEAILIARLYEA